MERRKQPGWLPRVRLCLLGCVLLLSACRSRTRREWLCLFIDGIPPDSASASADGQMQGPAEKRAAGRQAGESGDAEEALPPVPKLVLHEPFRRRQCQSCHASEFSERLVAAPEQLCMRCHSDLLRPESKKHYPVEAGECLVCHDPHQSGELRMLKQPVAQLCYECHDEDETARTEAHVRADNLAGCTACHDPHQADREHFLKNDMGQSRVSPQ